MQTTTLFLTLLLATSAFAFAPRVQLETKATGKVCEICEVVVKVVAGLLNLDQSQIEQELDKECAKLGPLQGVCKMVVDGFLPKIIQYLNEGNSPAQVCQRLKLCESTPQQERRITFKSSGAICPICEMLVKTVASLANMDENQIKTKLEADCEKLGPLSSVCKGLVDAYLPKILEYLNQGTTPEMICAKLGLCPASRLLKKLPAPAPKASISCEICEVLVKVAAQFINSSQNEIETKLNEACDDLGPVASLCKSVVKEYVDKIVQYLNQGQSADQVCQQVGLCDSKRNMVKLTKQPKDLTCTLCQDLVETVVQFLNQSEGQIQQDLDKYCNNLGPVASVCQMIVDTYLKKIVDYLNQGKNSTWICQEIGLCDSFEKAFQRIILKPVVKVEKQPKDLTCTLCQDLVETVVQFLNQSEGQIQQDLDKYCNNLGPVASVCQMIVDTYLKKIVDYLNQGKNATWICQEIDLCDSFQKALEKKKMEVAEKTKGLSCTICTDLVQAAAQYLNLSEPEIAKKLKDDVCSKLGFLESTCDALVDQYLPDIVKYLQSGSTASEVCSKLDLCSKMMHMKRGEILRPEPRGISCTLCEKIVGVVDKLVANDQSTIEAYLKKECQMLGPLASQCTTMVDKYLQQIIAFLNQGTAAEEICDKLRLCGGAQVTVDATQDCSICTAMAQLAVNLLNQGVSQNDIQTRLLAECNKFGTSTARCKSIINQNFQQFIGYLQGGMTPAQLCQKLGYC